MRRTQSKTGLSGFGKRLKQVRQEQKLSGPALAAKLGVERSMIPSYETERTFPSLVILARIVTILQVSLDWLVFGEAAAHNDLHDKELEAYFKRVDQLESRERSVVKLLLESILKRQEADESRRHGDGNAAA